MVGKRHLDRVLCYSGSWQVTARKWKVQKISKKLEIEMENSSRVIEESLKKDWLPKKCKEVWQKLARSGEILWQGRQEEIWQSTFTNGTEQEKESVCGCRKHLVGSSFQESATHQRGRLKKKDPDPSPPQPSDSKRKPVGASQSTEQSREWW